MNGGPYNIRYSELVQITPKNVGKLQVAWTWDGHDAFKDSEMQEQPHCGGWGTLRHHTSTMKVIVALDAATGREIWKFDPSMGSTSRSAASDIAA